MYWIFSTCKNTILFSLNTGVITLSFFFAFVMFMPLHAQKSDTVSVKTKLHSPKKATLFSAILPGSGQVYNHKYWKVPVIYAGFAGFGYGFMYNHDKYKKYKKAYTLSLDSNITNDIYEGFYSSDNLKSLMDGFHRWRDINAIGLTMLYVLNIVDAAVDAHLFDFKAQINSDLTLNFRPVLISSTFAGVADAKGLQLTLTLR